MSVLRIALFGGSFDPPHRGHLAIARAAADAFHLDQVLFAPTGRQPLKPEGATASFSDRLAMVTLACKADCRFLPSTIDAPTPDNTPNFTVETLHRLRAEFPGAALYNILGADSFRTLAQWHEPATLLQLVDWIVVSRPNIPLEDPEGMALTSRQREKVQLLTGIAEEVSATELRHRMLRSDSCENLLPPAVEAYIGERGLYR